MKRLEFKTQVDGSLAELPDASNVVDVTAATTLTHGDSGKTLILKNATGVAITLPAPKRGFELKVVTGLAFATTPFTVVAPSAVIQGGAIVNNVFVPAANENTITFVATAETLGDYIELTSDGTNYYVNGVATAEGAITFTAV